jgi:hypothetical protein
MIQNNVVWATSVSQPRASDEHPGKQHHEDAYAEVSDDVISVVRFGA